MVDQLIYRLNRVPDRLYVKFLELIGVELRPPAAARGEVTFWLSAPQPQDVSVRAETEVATPRTDIENPIVFTTVSPLNIVSCTFRAAGAQAADSQPQDYTADLDGGGFSCFSEIPRPGDALLLGLSNAVPSCAVLLRLDCRVAGVGVDPDHPPLVWEAWTGAGWAPCALDLDETGGLNRAGDVILHVPPTHQASTLARQHAGWLRCRLIEPEPEQQTYFESPRILGVTAATIGGTVRTVHAEVVRNEIVGLSDGSSAQRFPLQRRPIVPWEQPTVVRVSTDTGWDEWTPVAHFAESSPDDRHFRLDAFAGELQFGPAVRRADGTLQRYGAVPAKGAHIQVDAYRTGGGQSGNVARGKIRVLKTSTPYVARVENRAPAIGGADGESLPDAKVRGPLLLRSRGRAVTSEDFEELAREVAPDAARVQCVETLEAVDAGGVRLLVVPHLPADPIGRISRDDLVPPLETMARITGYLDERRLVGTRLVVEPPRYRWLTVVVSASARRPFRAEDVREQVLAAVYGMFHPLTGGPDGTGWPFGRSVQAHEVAAVLARLPGIEMSRDLSVALFPADANGIPGQRGAPVERLDLAPNELVFSYEHQIRVQP
jgi:predicted phage baseplate assembly protein